MRPRRPAPLVLLLIVVTVVAACGGASVATAPAAPASSSAPVASGAPASVSPSPGNLVNLDVDACAFLDVGTVRSLTGVPEEYTADSSSGPHEAKCFWGVPKPGFPSYVELRLFRGKGLAGYNFGQGCSATPIDGVGEEAAFVNCTPDPQTKTSMLVLERGVVASILVNEPAAPVTSAKLGPVLESVFDKLP